MIKFVLMVVYLSGKAFGWCLVSFALLAGLFVQVDYALHTLGTALALGAALLILSSLSYSKLLEISDEEM